MTVLDALDRLANRLVHCVHVLQERHMFPYRPDHVRPPYSLMIPMGVFHSTRPFKG